MEGTKEMKNVKKKKAFPYNIHVKNKKSMPWFVTQRTNNRRIGITGCNSQSPPESKQKNRLTILKILTRPIQEL